MDGKRPPHPPAAAADLTVAELVARNWEHTSTYYRLPGGSHTSERAALRLALGEPVRLYGRQPAASFAQLAFEAVRQAMIAKGWGRSSANNHAGRLKRLFGWAVSK